MIVDASTAHAAWARSLTAEDVTRLAADFERRPATDPLRRVDDLIHAISDGVWFAGHLDRIEFEVWTMVHTRPRTWVVGGADTKQVRAWVEEIRSLTVAVDEPWWVRYDLDSTVFDHLLDITGRVVTASEWDEIVTRDARRPDPKGRVWRA